MEDDLFNYFFPNSLVLLLFGYWFRFVGVNIQLQMSLAIISPINMN